MSKKAKCIVEIEDDLDLGKIAASGQCFRVKSLPDGGFSFITGNHLLHIRKETDRSYSISCDRAEWEQIWRPYFDLDRDYSAIRRKMRGADDFLDKAMDYGRGLRILRQDPWEMLITFIISQRKSIPSISRAVETLSERYGQEIFSPLEEIKAFPSPRELSSASVEDLQSCGLGYRAPYVHDATCRVTENILNLDKLSLMDDGGMLEELMKVHGVGIKVANCVCLFGYGRMGCVPIDTWISKTIRENFKNENPFPALGENAGIMQQYVFFYVRSNR